MSVNNGGHAEIKRERGSESPRYTIHVGDAVNHEVEVSGLSLETLRELQESISAQLQKVPSSNLRLRPRAES